MSNIKSRLCGLVVYGLLSLASVTADLSVAQVASSADVPYQSLLENRFLFVFPEVYKPLLPEILHYQKLLLEEYESSFAWTLDERTDLILTSPRQQIVNGYATVMPNLKTVFYPGGGGAIESFASSSWAYTLLNHELAHLYQLNVKHEFSSAVKSVLGNTLVFVLPFGVPIFVHPNVFIPTFVIEGNAVYNESRFGLGGRLYSGEIRALAFAQINENHVHSDRLLNQHLDFPFGAEKYELGGYFQQYLAERFGTTAVNQFFKAHADNFIFPLSLNQIFLKQFGFSYNQLLFDFSESLKPSTRMQQKLAEPAFAKSLTHSPLNHDQNKVFFLASSTLRSDPLLFKIDKKSEQIQSSEENLVYGKVFEPSEGLFASKSSRSLSPYRVEFSLFTEGAWPLDEFRSQDIQDLRARQKLWIDPVNSLTKTYLYKNDQLLDSTSSTAILDETGQAYYFKQEGLYRVLYKDKVELLRFEGFYSKPLEVGPEGQVWFVASTALGSSLFEFSSEGIRRLFPSDLIVDARSLGSNRFVVVEVTANAYEYKIAEAQGFASEPAKIQYESSKQPLFSSYQMPPAPELINPEVLKKSKSYNSLTNLRYSYADAGFESSVLGGLGGFLSANFTDPLEYNRLGLIYRLGPYQTTEGALIFSNSQTPVNFSLAYARTQSAIVRTSDNTVFERISDQQALVRASLPIYRKGYWDSNFSLDAGWLKDERFQRDPIERLQYGARLLLSRVRSQPLSYSPYRALATSIFYQYQTDPNGLPTDELLGGSLSLSGDLGKETFLSLGGVWSEAKFDSFKLSHRPLLPDLSNHVFKLSEGDYDVKEVRGTRLRLTKVVNWSKYFSRFPISLRRLAPYAELNYFDIREVSGELGKEKFWERAVGVEFEVLIAHLFLAQIPIEAVEDSFRSLGPDYRISIKSEFSF